MSSKENKYQGRFWVPELNRFLRWGEHQKFYLGGEKQEHPSGGYGNPYIGSM